MVIVCDMWLTGFDVPCLHTMYIDKPMRGHNLMQAKLKVVVKRLLRQYGYPPNLGLLATENVLKQAELLADEWVA